MHDDAEYDILEIKQELLQVLSGQTESNSVWRIITRPAYQSLPWRFCEETPEFATERIAQLTLRALKDEEQQRRVGVDRVPVVFNYSYDEIIGFADIQDDGTALITITDSRLVGLIAQDKKDTLTALSVTFTPAENANVSGPPSPDRA